MAESLTFSCGTCGEVHEGLPDYGYDTPIYYCGIPEAERAARCQINSDICVIDNEHFFVRAVLLVPILGTEESFGWGLWVSLAEADFRRTLELWDAEDVIGEGPFYGLLSNRLPFYPDTLELAVRVHLQNGGQRPRLELEPSDHPLACEQRDGLSWDRTIELAERLMHSDDA